MKKTLGLCVIAIGLLMIAGSFTFTPPHAINAVDSTNGIDASAGLVYGGFIVFGIGLVIYSATIPFEGKKIHNY